MHYSNNIKNKEIIGNHKFEMIKAEVQVCTSALCKNTQALGLYRQVDRTSTVLTGNCNISIRNWFFMYYDIDFSLFVRNSDIQDSFIVTKLFWKIRRSY